MDSPFDVLRIDSDADEGEIERAYKRRVKETHPDQGGSAEEFRVVRAAYEELASGDRSGEYGIDRRDVEQHQQRQSSQVEYLDYAVLEDYGWSLDDEDLFETASDEGLDRADYGRIEVEPGESLLEAAESAGLTWPYSCRGGACANCAVAVRGGDLSMPSNHILPTEMLDRGVRLSCIGAPTTPEMKVVYNVKYMPDLDELRLPPGPFEHAND